LITLIILGEEYTSYEDINILAFVK
jgi:hypothetical protein